MSHPFEERLAEILAPTLKCVAEAVHPLTPPIDANPKGLEAVVLAATLRAYADILEMSFDEGNKMGPLKTAVDEVRGRCVRIFQQGMQG